MDYTDAQQRNISKTDVDYVAQHSGKNIKGYQPGGQVDAVNHFWTEQSQKGQEDALKHDPTYSATLHGNQPHPGARVDKDLQKDDEETVVKMDERKRHV